MRAVEGILYITDLRYKGNSLVEGSLQQYDWSLIGELDEAIFIETVKVPTFELSINSRIEPSWPGPNDIHGLGTITLG